jgi:(1->4)-alpha-D-glucan 1-alpha-D-glucosylmutase
VKRIHALPHGERAPYLERLLAGWRDGRIKLLTTTVGLHLRNADPELFLSGQYLPLDIEVTVNASAVAFARIHGESAAVFVGPRLAAPLIDAELRAPLGSDKWKTSRLLLPPELAGRMFRHEITGADLRPTTASGRSWIFLGQIFEQVPIGILRAV